MKTARTTLYLAVVALGLAVLPQAVDACGAVDLKIIKEGPDKAVPGEIITYAITVSQHASGLATKITLTDVIPAGLTFLPGKSSAGCSVKGGTVHCGNVGNKETSRWGTNYYLRQGKSSKLKLAFQLSDTQDVCGPIKNVASVSAAESDVNPGDETDSATTNVMCATPTPTPTPEPKKELEIVKTDGGRDVTRPGHTFSYELTVRNTGEIDLQDVKVMDAIPNAFEVISASDNGQISGQDVSWTNLELEAGQSRAFAINVKVRDNAGDGEVCNTGKTRSDDHDLSDEDDECITVEKKPEVKSVVVVKPKAVPVTAETGPGLAVAVISTMLGAAGLSLRKLIS